MGLIGSILGVIFGGDRNVVRDTVEVFRPSAEADATRDAARYAPSLAQFAAEFTQPRRGVFDRLIDGLNRIPRPFLALGTLGLFVSAMVEPIWFSQRMQGIALVPEPLWWRMGAIVSFYFGTRHQTKSQEFQNGIATTLSGASDVAASIKRLADLASSTQSDAETTDTSSIDLNPALSEWSARNAQ